MAKAQRPGLVVDATEAAFAAGMLNQLCVSMSTQAYKRDVVDATHSYFAAEFDKHMSSLAKSNPDQYHHVFENRMVGINSPQAKLWTHRVRGDGDNKVATWDFQMAKTPRLTPPERRQGRIIDPIQSVPLREYRRYMRYWRKHERTYMFPEKAYMLEYDIKENVQAQNVKYLWIPDERDPSGVRFAVQNMEGNKGRGVDTTGQFTNQWVLFWNGVVPAMFDQTIGLMVEKDLDSRAESKLARRPRGKSFTLNVISDTAAAQAAGRKQGIAIVKENQRTLKGIKEASESGFDSIW